MGTTCQKGFKYRQNNDTVIREHSSAIETVVVSLRRGARVR
jgi:hypothetical protein